MLAATTKRLECRTPTFRFDLAPQLAQGSYLLGRRDLVLPTHLLRIMPYAGREAKCRSLIPSDRPRLVRRRWAGRHSAREARSHPHFAAIGNRRVTLFGQRLDSKTS